MKRIKTNIFVIAVLGGLMACGPIASAQTNSTPAAPDSPATGRRGPRGADMQKVIASLDLTPEQDPKVKEILKDQRDKMTALRDDSNLSTEDRRAKMKEITTATDAKMKDILTPNQYTKWEEARKAMRQRMLGNGPKPGGDTNSTPKTN